MAIDFDEARALHDEVCAIDLHADTPKLMDKLDFDISKRHTAPLPKSAYAGHLDIPRMHEGGLSAQFFGLWTFPKPESGCARSVHDQLDAIEKAVKAHPELLISCRSHDEILKARAEKKIAALAGIEGGHALEGKAENVEVFARRGVRYLGLLHLSANALGAPAIGFGRDDTKGLTAHGKRVVEEANRCGVIVDLAHINRKGFFEALEVSTTVPIVSHAGVAGVHAHRRNVDDDQIRAIANRGGVVGIIFAPQFLGGSDIGAVCDHLLHVIDIAGEDVPALGSDFDGFVTVPKGLEDVAALPRLTAALLNRGLSRTAARKLLGENAMRVIREVPPKPWAATQNRP